jgi:hypothetical protein
MDDDEPTVRSRELGLAVHHAMRAAGLNQTDLARKLKWVPSRVSRMLSGKRRVSPVDMSAVLAVLDITGPKRHELLRLAAEAAQPGWWQEYGDRLPTELRTLSDHEDAAIAVTSFETTLVPGLLQTIDYMSALMAAEPAIPDVEISDRVLARQRRQEVFNKLYPATFHFFIDEYIVRRAGAGREVMSEQVHHLLRMSVRPTVEIRVIPDAVGFHAGIQPFQIMEFTEISPVVHIESQTSVLFLERPDTIAAYRRTVAELSKVALNEGQSRSWLATLATELGEPREDHDAQRRAGIHELEEEFPI